MTNHTEIRIHPEVDLEKKCRVTDADIQA